MYSGTSIGTMKGTNSTGLTLLINPETKACEVLSCLKLDPESYTFKPCDSP